MEAVDAFIHSGGNRLLYAACTVCFLKEKGQLPQKKIF